jgi:glucose/mannose-6-phosphate isomerase
MFNELMLWTKKLNDGYELAADFHKLYVNVLPRAPKKIVFVGMGGSGIAGRIFKTFFDQRSEIPVHVVAGPTMPSYVDSQTLAIVISYSGNTWETLDVLKQLSDRHVPLFVLAHGGRAAEIAQLRNIPFTLIPESSTPRSALGIILGFLCCLFEEMNLLPGKQIFDAFYKHASTYLSKFSNESFFEDFINKAKGYDSFHIWGIEGYTDAVAYRSQTQFNENSKVAAVFGSFPEVCHNLIVGFTQFAQKPLVMLCETSFLPAHLDIALDAASELLYEKGVVLYKSPILGDTFEEQLFNIILWSDFASCYLAQERGVQARPNLFIDELKEKQKQKGIK